MIDPAACDLTQTKCIPCTIGTPPLTPEQIADFKKQLKLDWEVIDDKRIKYDFRFETFMKAIEFINKIAELAEKEGHHPDIHNYYNKVVIELHTHKIDGLSEADFILASKIELIN